MPKSLSSLLCLLFMMPAMAGAVNPPEKVFINRLGMPVDPEEAVGWMISEERDSSRMVQRTWYMNGQLKSEIPFYILRGHQLAHGTERHWNEEGVLVMETAYQYGHLHGMVRTWYPNGQLRREEEYSANLLQQGFCRDEQGNPTECPELYQGARFPGEAEGLQRYIDQNLHYPFEALLSEAEGVVQVRLLLDSLGQPAEARVINRTNDLLEDEALRLVMAMPPWEPARKEGRPVAEVFDLQIPFRLEDYAALYTPKVVYEYEQIPGDTVYFDHEERMVVARHAACEYMVTEELKPRHYVQRTFSMEHLLLEEVHYEQTSFMSIALHGPWKKWNRQGQQLVDLNLRDGELHGVALTWWPDGQLKRQDEYRKGKLKSGACYDARGNELEHFPYWVHPDFPGGEEKLQEYIHSELQYPGLAQVMKKSGTVMVKFVIDKEGKVTQAEVVRGVYPELDYEALRVVEQMPRWQPQVVDGEPEEVVFVMPVHFELNL